ncbi:MAG: serine hydrolase, partial [Trueperaceae bacterium]
MRQTPLGLLIAFLTLGVLAPAALAQPTPEALEAFVDSVVQGQLDATGIPGATVAVVLDGD